LILKKLELLQDLLTVSQLFLLDQKTSKTTQILKQRQVLLEQLQQNDHAIQKHEASTGIIAVRQEKVIARKINRLVKSIHENNSQTIEYLNREKKILELERLQMERNNKLTDYIAQQNGTKSMRNRSRQHIIAPMRKNQFRGQVYGQY